MKLRMNRCCWIPLLALIATTCGCVRESVEDGATVYQNELWVTALVLVGGIIGGVAGWMLRESSSRWGWALLIGGPVAAIFFAPSLFFERATVAPTGFSARSGIWGMTAVHEVPFDNLARVRITSEEVRGRRGRKETKVFFICEQRDGSSVKVPVNNDVKEAAATRFLEVVTERGVPVNNETVEGL